MDKIDDTLKEDYHCRIHVEQERFSDYCERCVRQKKAGQKKPSCKDEGD